MENEIFNNTIHNIISDFSASWLAGKQNASDIEKELVRLLFLALKKIECKYKDPKIESGRKMVKAVYNIASYIYDESKKTFIKEGKDFTNIATCVVLAVSAFLVFAGKRKDRSTEFAMLLFGRAGDAAPNFYDSIEYEEIFKKYEEKAEDILSYFESVTRLNTSEK